MNENLIWEMFTITSNFVQYQKQPSFATYYSDLEFHSISYTILYYKFHRI